MISRLHGTLIQKSPPQIVVDVHGVGYELDVPMSTFYGLPECGGSVTLHTHLAVREDGHFLYGFASEPERATFRQLLKVSGIGARTALAILSGLSVAEFTRAIALQESARLIRIPGIGKKTAERLLLELRDRFSKSGAAPLAQDEAGTPLELPADPHSDIRNALIALGYNEREATLAMKDLAADVDVSGGIRLALKSLSKG